jgi:DNA-binding CsgD family transcriptional regulator
MAYVDTSSQFPKPPIRTTLAQRVAHTAVDISYSIMRAEDYRDYLVEQTYRLFAADAGAGLAVRQPNCSPAAGQLTIVVAGTAPISQEQGLRARRFTRTHPGFSAMARVGTTDAVRVSDHTELVNFWTTETYWQMHGHFDGRYPASAVLLDTRETHIFLGIHRRARDFTDAELAGLAALQRPLAAALSFRAALDDTVQLLQNTGSGALGEPEFGPGRRRTLDAAVRLCEGYAPTRREGEVLALAAEGWTNHQIGRRLGITERTVRKHLTAVYDKAGVRGRAAAAAWWQRRHD